MWSASVLWRPPALQNHEATRRAAERLWRIMLSTRIDTGKLRHQIDIVAPTNSQDASGGISLNQNTVVATVCGRASTPLPGGTSLLSANSFRRRHTKLQFAIWLASRRECKCGFEGDSFRFKPCSILTNGPRCSSCLCSRLPTAASSKYLTAGISRNTSR